jgi:catechol 2,3-dioxygenase-like lactoylglutathione lyase family enzyme
MTQVLRVQALDHLTITVSDVERSVRFYSEVLGMERGPVWPGEVTMMTAGDTHIAIAHWAKGEKPSGTRPPITVDHFAFRVDKKTFELAARELPERGVKVEHVSDHGIQQSIYFRDPDGHQLELTCYEIQGKPERMPAKQ